MPEDFNDLPVVDLDRLAGPPEGLRKPRRQCAYCYTNRSSIAQWALKDSEDRALQALRRAHPEEYAELLQRERDAAENVTAQAWELHAANKCAKAARVAGTATNHPGSR